MTAEFLILHTATPKTTGNIVILASHEVGSFLTLKFPNSVVKIGLNLQYYEIESKILTLLRMKFNEIA